MAQSTDLTLERGGGAWCTVGVAMAVLVALAILFSAARAFVDPVGLAAGMGLPLAADGHDSFVSIYGIRSLFLSLFALILIWRADWRTLELYVFAAVLIALGDALLVASEHGPLPNIGRQLGIAAFLFVTGMILRQARTRRVAASA